MLAFLLSMVAMAEPAVQGETRWVIGEEAVASYRFVTDTEANPEKVATGTSGTVLFEEAGRVRLRTANGMFWVATESTSTEAPAAAVPDLEELKKMLQMNPK